MKGISPIVSELILIAISVLLTAVLYVWTANLMASLAEFQFTKPLMPSSVQTFWADCYGGRCSGLGVFVALQYTTQGGASVSSVVVKGGGAALCSITSFVPYALEEPGMCAFGYYGNARAIADDADAPPPGALFLGRCNALPGTGSVDLATSLNLGVGRYGNAAADPWATVLPGYVTVFQPAPTLVETEVQYTSTNAAFRNLKGDVAAIYYPINGTFARLPAYGTVTISSGTWTLLVWCPNVNALVLDSLAVEVTVGGVVTRVLVPIGVM
ncbi:MAG: hypothetical protein GXO07_05050 [Crenarchaeota archaeon]|nr:hypothetical protein [Thermoproteota archaeon]